MAGSNTVLIKRLQSAINTKFNAKLLYNRTQWYSEQEDRPVTVYKISKAIWDEERGKTRSIELFSSYSQIQIVLWLRDYWYELNGWEIPDDNPTWTKAKEDYQKRLAAGKV